MAGVGGDEGLVQHERGFLEASLEIAVRPGFRCTLHHRQAAGVGLGEFSRRPLHFTDLRSRWALRRRGSGRRWRRNEPVVAFRARVGAVGTQAHQRIDYEGKRLVLDLDPLDGLGCRRLVDRRDRQDRLTLVDRFLRQRDLAVDVGEDQLAVIVHGVGRRGQVVEREDGLDAWQGHRRACYRCGSPARADADSIEASRRACPPRESLRRTCSGPSPSR